MTDVDINAEYAKQFTRPAVPVLTVEETRLALNALAALDCSRHLTVRQGAELIRDCLTGRKRWRHG